MKQIQDVIEVLEFEIRALRLKAALIDERNKYGALKEITVNMRIQALRLEQKALTALRTIQNEKVSNSTPLERSSECASCNGVGLKHAAIGIIKRCKCRGIKSEQPAAAHGVKFCAIRGCPPDAENIEIECRFENGEKYTAITVCGQKEQLAQFIVDSLNAPATSYAATGSGTNASLNEQVEPQDAVERGMINVTYSDGSPSRTWVDNDTDVAIREQALGALQGLVRLAQDKCHNGRESDHMALEEIMEYEETIRSALGGKNE